MDRWIEWLGLSSRYWLGKAIYENNDFTRAQLSSPMSSGYAAQFLVRKSSKALYFSLSCYMQSDIILYRDISRVYGNLNPSWMPFLSQIPQCKAISFTCLTKNKHYELYEIYTNMLNRVVNLKVNIIFHNMLPEVTNGLSCSNLLILKIPVMHIVWQTTSKLCFQRHLLLNRFNFNSNLRNILHPLWIVGWNYLSIDK